MAHIIFRVGLKAKPLSRHYLAVSQFGFSKPADAGDKMEIVRGKTHSHI